MIPDEIKKHRPKGSEIHAIGGRYYAYKTTSVWDAGKKRAKKKTLGCIGRITVEDGFIPSKPKEISGPVTVKEYGCFALFSALVPELSDQLCEVFGKDIGQRTYAVAMLRLMGKTTKAGIRRYYHGSWLSEKFPDLALSENTMTSFMRILGNARSGIRELMEMRLPTSGAAVLFDGTAILSSSKTMTYACYGRSQRQQINLLYAFSQTDHAPCWYRLLPGNIADMAAFETTLKECGIRDCTVVADKGFFSKVNVSALDKAALNYVLPLKANTTLIDTGFTSDASTAAYDGCFEYHRRVIWHKTIALGAAGKRVHVFRDEGKRAQLELNFVRRMEADYESCDRATLEEKKTRFGLSYLYSNLDVSSHEVYLAYKARWEIEECFDYLKNSLDLGCVYQRSNEEAEAWAFLNHLSLTMFYALYAAIAAAKLPSRWTPETVMAMAKNINRVKIGQTWLTTEISKADRSILEALGVIL